MRRRTIAAAAFLLLSAALSAVAGTALQSIYVQNAQSEPSCCCPAPERQCQTDCSVESGADHAPAEAPKAPVQLSSVDGDFPPSRVEMRSLLSAAGAKPLPIPPETIPPQPAPKECAPRDPPAAA